MDKEISWFGIDFGTTNSAVFSFTGIDKNDTQLFSYGDDEGRPFPSVVAIDRETGEVITGREAKNRRNSLVKTHEYFSSVKSIIDSDQTWEIAGKKWTPEDIVSEIFLSLKKRVEEGNANQLKEAVVSVPIGFTAKKRGHLRRAARQAGIKIKMFVSEPTAAFCSNYTNLKGCKNVAVFDWGGGTLDVAILRIENGNISELATEGRGYAGDDIDKKIAEKIHDFFMHDKIDPISFEELDPVTKDQLLMKCEKAKCDFADEEIVRITINKYDKFGPMRDSMNYNVFSDLLENDIDDALKCLERAINKAGLNKINIDRILCVGGSSKLRPLREKLTKCYGEDTVFYPESVMWDIAKGAAMLSTRPGSYKLGKSIGMMLSDGTYFPFFKTNQPIPCQEMSVTLGIVQNNENGINEARFVFTDSPDPDKREFVENFILPLRGHNDEVIKLFCYVDEDNVFKLKVGSNRMLDNSYRVWKYEKLKVRFSLEGKDI